jgi:hypothetical protein
MQCGHRLAYLPDVGQIGSLGSLDNSLWHSPAGAAGAEYRLCANYTSYDVCNWAVVAADANPLCVSCRLTRVIPDLDVAGHREAWYRLEIAKRRLLYTLLKLHLPVTDRQSDPSRGLAFELEADVSPTSIGRSAFPTAIPSCCPHPLSRRCGSCTRPSPALNNRERNICNIYVRLTARDDYSCAGRSNERML